MGRMITAISFPPNSPFHYVLQDMKRSGKNVSATVCDIIARHYELYDKVTMLEERNAELLRSVKTLNRAIEAAGLIKQTIRDDFGMGQAIDLRLTRSEEE